MANTLTTFHPAILQRESQIILLPRRCREVRCQSHPFAWVQMSKASKIKHLKGAQVDAESNRGEEIETWLCIAFSLKTYYSRKEAYPKYRFNKEGEILRLCWLLWRKVGVVFGCGAVEGRELVQTACILGLRDDFFTVGWLSVWRGCRISPLSAVADMVSWLILVKMKRTVSSSWS